MKFIGILLFVILLIPLQGLLAQENGKERIPTKDELNKVSVTQGKEYCGRNIIVKVERGKIIVYINEKGEIFYIEEEKGTEFTLIPNSTSSKKVMVEGEGKINVMFETPGARNLFGKAQVLLIILLFSLTIVYLFFALFDS